MNGSIFLVSALLPFLLILIWKLEGKTADSFASIVTGLALLFNIYGCYLFFQKGSEKLYHYSYVSTGKLGEVFGLNIDVASVLMGLFSILIAFLLVLYSIAYISKENRAFPLEKGKGKFYAFLGLLIGASMIFTYSTNLIQFAFSLELMAIGMLYLVDFHGNARLDAIKAFLVLNLGVLLILGAIVILGSKQVLFIMPKNNAALLLIMFAGFAMSSQLLFYSWLPDATVSPLPATAYVHSASIVPLGPYMLFRVIQFTKPDDSTFWVLGGLTVALMLLMMIYYPLQRDAKKLIAYSTIAQAGVAYITLAYALLGHVAGIQIAVYQVVNHMVVKTLAFASVGGLAYSMGTTDLGRIRGIRKVLPWTGIAWFLSFFGLAGVLPLGMFFSKAFTIMITKHAKGIASWLFPGIVLIDAAIFLVVVLLWFREFFFNEPTEEAKTEPKLMVAVMLVLIIIGVLAPWITLDIVMKIGFAR